MLTFDIWWKDLTKEAQQEYLDFFGFKEEDFDDYTLIACVDVEEEVLFEWDIPRSKKGE